MTTTYTTAALVKKQVSHLSSSLADSDIEAMINQAENMVDAVMKKSGIHGDFTFDASKHGLIRMATTLIAAYLALTYDTEQFSSSSHASLTADLLYAKFSLCLDLLSDSRVVEYLTNL